MAAASPWVAPSAAEWAPESMWAEEETEILMGTAAAGPCWACLSYGYRPCHPPGCSGHLPRGLLIVVIAWLHVLLCVTSVKVASRLSLLILIGGFLHVKTNCGFSTELYEDK